jgi:hypothetical protein
MFFSRLNTLEIPLVFRTISFSIYNINRCFSYLNSLQIPKKLHLSLSLFTLLFDFGYGVNILLYRCNFRLVKISPLVAGNYHSKKQPFFFFWGRKSLIYRSKRQRVTTLNGVLFHYLTVVIIYI